ncbi:MAG: ribonuclease J [Firmicutes bacterium]|nr:ribonuclease J [Bacillota bacterium]
MSQQRTRTRTNKKKLKIIPLGGLHEIGKNLTVVEYGEDILLIDCGMAFPENDMFGVDVVIPDFTYLRENSHKIKGLIITHAHEDHIGAVPFLVRHFNVPIYGTKLALGFIKLKLKEHKLEARLNEIQPGELIRIGCFKIEAIHTTHSVADSLAYAITTPVGVIFHTGDFKIDLTPIDGATIDFSRVSQIGDDGVLLLMSDSTNSMRKGYSVSERSVAVSLENIFQKNDKRIIIATFSSNVHRVQSIINIAAKNGRKVAFSGRSMENMVKLATELGYMTIPAGCQIDISQVRKYKDKELCILTTGSQGEPMSALSRMAFGEHKQISIKPGDCVILSSSPIPGNELTIDRVLNSLLEKGAEVIYSEIADVHASGHACQEELKIIQTMLKPKFFMPVHGEFKHLMAHAELARQLGMPDSHILIAENGSVVELTKDKARVLPETVTVGEIMVDGLGVGDVGAVVLNERRGLAEAGVITVTVVYDSATNELIAGPEMHTRGFTYMKEYGEFLSGSKEAARKALEKAGRDGVTSIPELRAICKNAVRKYVSDTLQRYPVVLPIVMKI